MALDQSALLEVLDALKAAEVDDRIRQAAQTIYQALIEAELTSVIGAAPVDSTGRRNTLTARGCDGNAQASTGRSCWAASDAFTRPSAGGATRAQAAVLGRDRPWIVE